VYRRLEIQATAHIIAASDSKFTAMPVNLEAPKTRNTRAVIR